MSGCGQDGCLNDTPHVHLTSTSYSGWYWPNLARQGWVCPKCGRVWGPETQGCWSCNAFTGQGVVVGSSGSTTGFVGLGGSPDPGPKVGSGG